MNGMASVHRHAMPRHATWRTGAAGGRRPSVAAGALGRRSLNATGVVTALGVVLGGNLFGATSNLLCATSRLPSTELLRDKLRIDVLYPVCGQKRYYSQAVRAEFLYPSGWLEDFTIQKRRQALLDKRYSIDPPAPNAAPRPRSDEALLSLLPVVAFGPPGTTGELNLSLVRQPLPEYATTLSDIGQPREVASTLLESIVRAGTQNGSEKKEYELLDASSFTEKDGAGTPVEYYFVEYIIQSPAWSRHNVASFAIYDASLYSLSCQVPRRQWPELEGDMRATARSLRLGV